MHVRTHTRTFWYKEQIR